MFSVPECFSCCNLLVSQELIQTSLMEAHVGKFKATGFAEHGSAGGCELEGLGVRSGAIRPALADPVWMY